MKEPEKEIEENNEESIWSEESFAETLGPEHAKAKMRTFHMKHDEEMNFNCLKCNVKISAHNKDWHAGMCDNCFNEKFFPNEKQTKLGDEKYENETTT